LCAAGSAEMRTAFSRIGAVLAAGMSWWLVRKLGLSRATALAMFGDYAITMEEAKEWGLVWEVVEDEALMARAGEVAMRLADGPTVALGLIKRELAFAEANKIGRASCREGVWR